MKAGGVIFRKQKKIGNVRSKRRKKSEPTARTSVTVGGAKLKRSKTAKLQEVIQPTRKGEVGGYPCSLAYNPKTHRYDLTVSERLVYSSVSHAACLQAAEVLKIVWWSGE